MRPTAVARRYARALADAAGGEDRLKAVAADLALAAQALQPEPRILRFFADPSIPEEHKLELIETLGKRAKGGDLTRNFYRLLVEKRRMQELPAIQRAFEQIKDDRLGLVAAEATTAVPLAAAEVKRLREALETLTGLKVNLTFQVDPAVLGGARTRIGSQVYDGTIRRRLELLRERLAGAR